MRTRDPRHRSRRYDGLLRRQQFMRWVIVGVRVLAGPTVLLSLLLAVDIGLPGTAEEGIVYRRVPNPRWVVPDGYTIAVGWPYRPECVEQRGRTNRRVLFPARPGCSKRIEVSLEFGRRLVGGDRVRVVRTPLFGQIRTVQRLADGRRDRWYPLLRLGLFISLGFLPLLSFGDDFAVHSSGRGAARYHIVYVLPALGAEALYVWFLIRALVGG